MQESLINAFETKKFLDPHVKSFSSYLTELTFLEELGDYLDVLQVCQTMCCPGKLLDDFHHGIFLSKLYTQYHFCKLWDSTRACFLSIVRYLRILS